MWDGLRQHKGARIADLLADEGRAEAFSVRCDGMLFDYSKTSMTAEARAALIACGLRLTPGAVSTI